MKKEKILPKKTVAKKTVAKKETKKLGKEKWELIVTCDDGDVTTKLIGWITPKKFMLIMGSTMEELTDKLSEGNPTVKSALMVAFMKQFLDVDA